jgi:hypothetical protein
VNHLSNGCGVDVVIFQQLAGAAQHRLRRVGVTCQHFADGDVIRLKVEENDIGEGSADVHGEKVRFGWHDLSLFF